MAKRLTLKFKKQQFQTEAAKAVTDVFEGQASQTIQTFHNDYGFFSDVEGFRNQPLTLPSSKLLDNVRHTQMVAQLPLSETIDLADLRLTIEMETGTGKTYTYIKTMYELNRCYGWSKFIIVVPSIAIREGVCRSFEIMSEHFAAEYGKRIHSFIYDSKQLPKIEQFASDSNMQAMIINTQAFAARGEDARRIYMKLDSFRSRKPIDVIASTRPILIIDEPQSVLGVNKKNATREKLKEFSPLFTLLYSATHRPDDIVNMVYRLDAMDAYNKKLVKKITVKGINQQGTTATNGYLYLERILLSEGNPQACISFDQKGKSGVKQTTRMVSDGFDIYEGSGRLEEYANGFRIESIDGYNRCIRLLNNTVLYEGDLIGRVNDLYVRRQQIRETILSHIHKERQLFKMGIKCLSLFFIDQVDHYRVYLSGGETAKGEYAQIFEEEYASIIDGLQLSFDDDPEYAAYLHRWKAEDVHNGYFSRDKKGHFIQPSKTELRNESSNDASAYDLIMKDKERLLSFDEPTRFIFSHSALKEGWDNPNVFQICTLKDSDNQTKKRQEVGRGMRLCVNSQGERQDETVLHGRVFEVNELTVIASESYTSFAVGLQKEIAEAVSNRLAKVQPKMFEGIVLTNPHGEEKKIDDLEAGFLFSSLYTQGYINKQGQLTQKYYDARQQGTLYFGEEYAPYKADIMKRLDAVFNPQTVKPENAREVCEAKFSPQKFGRKEFQELWKKINHQTYYTVDFNTESLIHRAVYELDAHLRVSEVNIQVTTGTLGMIESKQTLAEGRAMRVVGKETHAVKEAVNDGVKYDLVGKLVETTGLTRRAIVSILQKILPSTFHQFKTNPEEFIIKAGRIINQCKAIAVVEHVVYHKLDKTFSSDIFSASALKGRLGINALKSLKSLYDLVVVDSQGIEMDFAQALEQQNEVIVYTKLPGGFYINTPAGHYNPDWAIVFKETNDIKHIYFVAETKGYSDDEVLDYRSTERVKIECARRHFAAISGSALTYDVVKNYADLRNVITK